MPVWRFLLFSAAEPRLSATFGRGVAQAGLAVECFAVERAPLCLADFVLFSTQGKAAARMRPKGTIRMACGKVDKMAQKWTF